MNESAITIENLTKKYEDKTALEDLSLQVFKGELFGLLGPNGAGKTTTIGILCGLIKPTSGTAKIFGYDVLKETQKVKEQIGVCIQETAIYPYLTGIENLELFGKLYGMNKKTIKERSNIFLTNMALKEDAKRVTAKYSGGMKRRLSLALALIHDPQIAFLDEPTVAMDPQSRHAVWDFIKEQKTKGKTVGFSVNQEGNEEDYPGPAVLFMIFLFPIVFVFAFGASFGGFGGSQTATYHVGVVNLDSASNHQWSQVFTNDLSNISILKISTYTDNQTAQSDLNQGKIQAVIVIPISFSDSITSYNSAPNQPNQWVNTTVPLYLDKGSLIATQAVPPIIGQVLTTINN